MYNRAVFFPRQGKDEESRTPVYLACKHGLADIVAELVKKDANLSEGDERCDTPLHVAIREKHITIARKIIGKYFRGEVDHKVSVTGQKFMFLKRSCVCLCLLIVIDDIIISLIRA